MSEFFIYKFEDVNKNVLYIGKTSKLKRRLDAHFDNGHLGQQCYSDVDKIYVLRVDSKTEMDIKEIAYINKESPKYNKSHNRDDDVSFVNIENDMWEVYDREKPVKEEVERLRKEIKRLRASLLVEERRERTRVTGEIRLSLRELMDRDNITQMELSEMTGVRQASISNMCRNSFDKLHIPSLNKIIKHLGISDFNELFYVE